MFLFTLPNGKPVEPKGLTEQAALTKIIEEVYQGIAEGKGLSRLFDSQTELRTGDMQ
jgi:hypothetical protein